MHKCIYKLNFTFDNLRSNNNIMRRHCQTFRTGSFSFVLLVLTVNNRFRLYSYCIHKRIPIKMYKHFYVFGKSVVAHLGNYKIGESVVRHGYRAHDNIICLSKRELS